MVSSPKKAVSSFVSPVSFKVCCGGETMALISSMRNLATRLPQSSALVRAGVTPSSETELVSTVE